MQNIKVQLSGILTGELNADILCVLAGAEIRVKVSFTGEGNQEGENILFVRNGGVPRVGNARRPAGKVNIIGRFTHGGAMR